MPAIQQLWKSEKWNEVYQTADQNIVAHLAEKQNLLLKLFRK